MSYTLAEVCDHCGHDLGEHLVPDSQCPTPGATSYFFIAASHGQRSDMSDEPQFAVICREVGTPFINIYSRHVTRPEADTAKDRAAWKHNAQEVTYRLAVVEL